MTETFCLIPGSCSIRLPFRESTQAVASAKVPIHYVPVVLSFEVEGQEPKPYHSLSSNTRLRMSGAVTPPCNVMTYTRIIYFVAIVKETYILGYLYKPTEKNFNHF